jgi:hypothetical protein
MDFGMQLSFISRERLFWHLQRTKLKPKFVHRSAAATPVPAGKVAE